MLIAIEGIDGSGKSTLAAGLARALGSRGRRVHVIRRYAIAEITELWRTAVDADVVDQRGAALLAAADCAIAASRIVRPALAAGEVVVCDRYAYSHIAHYAARGVPLAQLAPLFAAAVAPDLVAKLDVDSRVALARLRAAGKPDFWEGGLDDEPPLSIGAAYRRYRVSPPDRASIEARYLAHQARLERALEAALPSDVTARIDAARSAADVLDACLALPAVRSALAFGA